MKVMDYIDVLKLDFQAERTGLSAKCRPNHLEIVQNIKNFMQPWINSIHISEERTLAKMVQ